MMTDSLEGLFKYNSELPFEVWSVPDGPLTVEKKLCAFRYWQECMDYLEYARARSDRTFAVVTYMPSRAIKIEYRYSDGVVHCEYI
jgi:hypothetical protein